MKSLNEEAQKVIDDYDMLLEFDLKKALATAMIGTSLATAPFQAQAQDNKIQPVMQVGREWVHNNSIVAKVLSGEAGGEGDRGMYAVANVIQNRMHKTGKTAEQIVTKPKQFSAIKDPVMMNRNYEQVKSKADAIAKRIGSLTEDITNGATHYTTTKFYNKYKNNPKHWVSKMIVTAVIGNHTFMREK